MNKYELITFDMDGTLLDSEKKISKDSIEMIKKAVKAGKKVTLSTGRCIPELNAYLKLLPEIQYIICMSGALVYDVINQRTINSHTISVPIVQKILKEVKDFNLMIHLLSTDSIVQKNKVRRMEDYHMGAYQTMFNEITIKPEDIFLYYEHNSIPLYKVNLYMRNQQERMELRKRLVPIGLTLIDAGQSSLECTAQNVSKGLGLSKLCDYLHIPLDRTIAVGDADNDLEILNCAGLAIAMGNATQSIRKIADVVVNDNDHNGCSCAIREYLL